MKDISEAILSAIANGTCQTEEDAEAIVRSLFDGVSCVTILTPREQDFLRMVYFDSSF